MTFHASTSGGRCFRGVTRGRDARRPQERAIRADRARLWCRRALCEVEDGGKLVRPVDVLTGQNGEILSDGVAKQRAEHPEIVAAPEACTKDRLLRQLVRRTQPRCPVEPVLRVAGQVDVADAADEAAARREIDPRAVPGFVDRLRVDDVEPQAIVERQLRVEPPGVLRVVEVAPLPLARVRAGADVAGELRHVSQHERGEAEAAASVGLLVRSFWNCNWPERWLSDGTRRL